MWNGPTFQGYYQQIGRMIAEQLDKENPGYLLQVDPEQYLDYLGAQAEWQPLEWDESKKTIEPFYVRTQRTDSFHGRTYVAQEQRLRIRIPISPHPQRDDYFKHGPSTTWAFQPEPAWKFENDTLVFEVGASEQAVQEGIKAVRFWLGGRNGDIAEGNRQLRGWIRPIWEAKRKQLEEKHGAVQAVLQKLNIPLHQDPNARAKPMEIKPRELRTVIEKPKPTAKPEPTLSRNDVIALVDFIEQYARQFEVTPKTYAKLSEEELRDLLIGMMNANYPGTTTGETFSKLGKTDISLRVNSGYVLICECEFWAGANRYGEKLEQLFDYLTWRQNYGVLVSFCKRKDMSRAVSAAQQAMREHPTFTAGSLLVHSETRFTSRHLHPQDATKTVEIHHLFFDLSI